MNDPLAFLDSSNEKEDPLAFLNSPVNKQPLSFLDEPKKPGLFQKFGEALVTQTKSGGFAGAPALTPEVGKKVATEFGTLVAVEAAFAPVIGLAAASQYAPRVLTALTRLTQAGATGAAVATTGKLIEEGELPSKEELVKDGLQWVAIDAIMQGLHVAGSAGKTAYDFGKAVNKIAKEEGVPATKVLGKLWDSTKNYIKQKFGRNIVSPDEILPGDVEILQQAAEEAEREGLSVIPKQIGYEQPKLIGLKEPKRNIRFQPDYRNLFTIVDGRRFDLEGEELKLGKQINDYLFYDKKPPEGLEDKLKSLINERLDSEEIQRQEKKSLFESLLEEHGETRGKGEFFHGSESKITTPHSEHYSHQNIYGQGFYTTDALDIATGYTKRKNQKVPHIYKIIEKDPVKFFNMESPIPSEIKQKLEEHGSSLIEENLSSDSSQTLRSLYDDIRHSETSADEIQEDFNYIREQFEKEGYGGYEHTGGLLTQNKPHNVKIYFYPEKQISIEDIKPKRKSPQGEVPLSNRVEKEKARQQQPSSMKRKKPVIGQKQSAKRSDIIKLFRKAFNDPIRLGKISQRNASGIHKMWSRVTRLLNDNNVETAAHEIGHNLHTILYGGNATTPKGQRDAVIRALKPYLVELKPLAGYEPYTLEGFAEFTRMYVTNPQAAQQLAPKFYQKFEADLDAQYPELRNALLEARDYYDTYLQGTPASRIDAQIAYKEKEGFLKSILEWVKDKGNIDKLKVNLLDDIFMAKRLVAEAFGIPTSEVENLKDERNLYRSLRVLKGAIGKADVYLFHETFDPLTLDKINGSFKDILDQLANDEEMIEFNRYLTARRTIEKLGQNVETGIELGDAIIEENRLKPKYGQLASELDKFSDTVLQYPLKCGLLGQDTYAVIKKNNLMYAPFQRDIETKGGVSSTGGNLQAGNPINRMTGSNADIIPPLESFVKNTYSIIINSEKNLAGKTLAKLAQMKGIGAYVEHVPTPTKLKGKIEGDEVEETIAKNLLKMGFPDLVVAKVINGKATYGLRSDISKAIPDVFLRFGAGQYPAGENIVTVFYDGKPNYFEVSPEIYQMWTKGIAPYTADLLTKILRVPARTLRAGAILNPRFIQKNFIRDTWGSALFTKYGKSIKDPAGLLIDTFYSPLAMLSQTIGKKDLYIEWMKSGGGMSTMQMMDRDNVIKKLEEVRDGLKLKPYQVVKWMKQVAEWSEEVNRLSEFGKALEVEGKTRLGREIAAFASRDLSIDFAKMGLLVKSINQIIPFFNATVQGGDKLLRTLADPESRKEFIPRAVGWIIIPSLILAWLNRDDDRVKEFYEEEKDFNFMTFIGDTALKFPVPFETGVIMHGLTQRMANYFMDKDPKAFEGFMGSVASAMLPNFIPTLANPFIETWANKSFFTGARIVPASQESLIAKYQYKRNTSITARLIGRAIAYMVGPETTSKAAAPAVIDHFINSWGGGLGSLIVSMSDMALEKAGLGDKIEKPDRSITEKLGLEAFIVRYPRAGMRSVEKFYDYWNDATARQKSFKFAEKQQLESPEEQQKAYQRFDDLYDYQQLKAAHSALSKSQKAINNIYNNPELDADVKKVMIDALYKQQIEFCKSANEFIEKRRSSKKS